MVVREERERREKKKNSLLSKFLKRKVGSGVKERERETKGKEGGGRYVRDIVKLVIMPFEARFISYCHCGL